MFSYKACSANDSYRITTFRVEKYNKNLMILFNPENHKNTESLPATFRFEKYHKNLMTLYNPESGR